MTQTLTFIATGRSAGRSMQNCSCSGDRGGLPGLVMSLEVHRLNVFIRHKLVHPEQQAETDAPPGFSINQSVCLHVAV